jgi:hypothetical protein
VEDGGGRNGLFTGRLLKNLPLDLEIKEVFNRTGLDVVRESGGRQVPAVYTEFFGHVFLSPNHRDSPVVPPSPVVAPLPRADTARAESCAVEYRFRRDLERHGGLCRREPELPGPIQYRAF